MLHAWIENNNLVVQNEGSKYTKFKVEVLSISYQHLLFHDVELKEGELVHLPFSHSNFFTRDIANNIRVRIYANSIIILEKVLYKNYDKAWILLSNKKYENLTRCLLDGLSKYTKYPIIHYSINYHPTFQYDNVHNYYIKVEDDNDGQVMQFMKSKVFLNALDLGVRHAIFLDSDIQVRPNIDKLFDIEQTTSGPIFQKSFWDYTLVGDLYVPGPELRKFLGLSDNPQTSPHGITNMVIFNQSHRELFQTWEKACFSPEIMDIKTREYLHDELILNALCWRDGYETNVVYVALNVLNEKDIKFFYQTPNFKGTPFFDYNKYGLGLSFQSFEPYNKEDICFFHCIKDIDTARKANAIIEEEEFSKNDNETFRRKLINFYSDITKSEERLMKVKPTFAPSYLNGASLTIREGGLGTYKTRFINRDTNQTVYEVDLLNNYFGKTSVTYYVPWLIQVEHDNLLHNIEMDFTNKRVFIVIDSKALGDTIAWLPYAEEFKNKHNCHVVVSTFHNDLFKEQYPNLEFVDPGKVVPNLYAQYTIGWYYSGDGDQVNLNRNPRDFKTQPMQKTASDILGLEYKELKPRIWTDKFTKYDVEKEKQVTIAIHGTFQAKYWNNLEGWQKVVDYLKGRGYKVKLLSTEPSTYMGSNPHPTGIEQHPKGPLKKVIKELQKSKLFIGIGSGLSWLSWAVGTPTALISGFSEPYTEPQEGVLHISAPQGVCSGCFNSHRFDPGDWNWCPMLKGTDRQFECSKSITGEMVIEKIKDLL